jgi:hypothetical protein
VSSGANDRHGFVQRIKEARRAYRGPFTGAHVQKVVEGEGYEAVGVDENESFLIYRKDGCKLVPVNIDWEAIWDDDPTFRCIQRDLGFSRPKLRTRLNQARNSTDPS